MVSVMVGFQYMLTEKFSVFFTMTSKKLIVLSTSFSIVNLIVVVRLLKELRNFIYVSDGTIVYN